MSRTSPATVRGRLVGMLALCAVACALPAAMMAWSRIEEARTELLRATEEDARNDMARMIRQVEADAREEAEVGDDGDGRGHELLVCVN